MDQVATQNHPCITGPDFYTNVLGPTADETILVGLETFMKFCQECPDKYQDRAGLTPSEEEMRRQGLSRDIDDDLDFLGIAAQQKQSGKSLSKVGEEISEMSLVSPGPGGAIDRDASGRYLTVPSARSSRRQGTDRSLSGRSAHDTERYGRSLSASRGTADASYATYDRSVSGRSPYDKSVSGRYPSGGTASREYSDESPSRDISEMMESMAPSRSRDISGASSARDMVELRDASGRSLPGSREISGRMDNFSRDMSGRTASSLRDESGRTIGKSVSSARDASGRTMLSDRDISEGTMSPSRDISGRTGSPSRDISGRTMSPSRDISGRTMSPSRDISGRTGSPSRDITEGSMYPSREISGRTGSPSRDLNGRDTPSKRTVSIRDTISEESARTFDVSPHRKPMSASMESSRRSAMSSGRQLSEREKASPDDIFGPHAKEEQVSQVHAYEDDDIDWDIKDLSTRMTSSRIIEARPSMRTSEQQSDSSSVSQESQTDTPETRHFSQTRSALEVGSSQTSQHSMTTGSQTGYTSSSRGRQRTALMDSRRAGDFQVYQAGLDARKGEKSRKLKDSSDACTCCPCTDSRDTTSSDQPAVRINLCKCSVCKRRQVQKPAVRRSCLKTGKCKCSSTSASNIKSANNIPQKAHVKLRCECRESSDGSADTSNDIDHTIHSQMGDTSEEGNEVCYKIRYAITKITKFYSYTTFEVMRSTSKKPKVMPKSLEGVFVLKNSVSKKNSSEA